MALVSNYSRTADNLLGQTRSIKSSLMETRKSFSKINNVFAQRTRVKSTIFKRRQTTNARKLEAEKRREQLDALQAAKLSIGKGGPKTMLAKSGKTFLGRILDFIASLAIGWALSNLPTWIAYGKAFVKRVGQLWNSLTGFVNGIGSFIVSFGNTLGGVLTQIASFQFSEIPTTVDNGMKEMDNAIKRMTDSFEEGISLFGKPLDVEQPSSGPSSSSPQQQSGASAAPGAAGTGRTYISEGGQTIVDRGGKDYGDYDPNHPVGGSRRNPRRHGVGGQQGHTGEDYYMPTGTPLSLIAKGTVHHVGPINQYNGGYGNFVVVKLDTGEYIKLAHLDSVNVREGEKVGAGSGPDGTVKVLGFSGSTGYSTGAHLHLDMSKSYDRNSYMVDQTLDPASFIAGRGLVIGENVKSTGEVKDEKKGTTGTTTTPTSKPQQSLIPTPSGGTLSIEQLVSLAKQVGFNQQNAVIAAAVAKAESGGRSGVVNDNPSTGDLSYGLWQINMIGDMGPARLKQFGITSYEQLKDPLTNAKAAYILSGGSNFSPWSVYEYGNYKQFLPAAQKAAGVEPGQFTANTSSNVPGSITPSKEGEIVFTQFPTSGASVPPGMEGSGDGYGDDSQAPIITGASDSEVLNNFIKKRLLVELSYL